MNGISIRKGHPGDLAAVVAVENEVFSLDRLSRRSLAYFLKSPTVTLLLAENMDRLNAYCLTAFRKGSKIARAYSLAVAPHAVGRGLGRHLMLSAKADAVARGANQMRLEVRPDNVAAIRLYLSLGYAEFGRIEDYYEDDTAALRMEKALG